MLERHIAPLHLLPDGESALLPPGDFQHLCTLLAADGSEFAPHFLDDIGPLATQVIQPRLDGVVRLRLQLREGTVLQFRLHRIHADARGERRIDVHGFVGDAQAALRLFHEMQGAHVVQPVRQLDEQHAYVAAHRQHQLAEILRLLGAVGLQLQASQLGDAIDQAGDRIAEAQLYVGQLDRRVLDRVVQQGGADAGHIQPVAGKDFGHGQRMGDVGVAIVTQLNAVRLGGDGQRILHQAGICPRGVGADGVGKALPAGCRRRRGALRRSNQARHRQVYPPQEKRAKTAGLLF